VNRRHDLLRAYHATDFIVRRPRLTIRVGRRCAMLDRLLTRVNVKEWAFVTAWNPGSRPLSRQANDARHRRLLRHLARWKRSKPDRARTWFAGVGRPRDGLWKPELSVLILGISAVDARRLGARFGQVAIVAGTQGRAARLLLC